jgi:transposase-like protein
MARVRRTFTPEFKRDAVRLALDQEPLLAELLQSP